MSSLIEQIRAAQARAAEDGVIASIPADVRAMLAKVQAEHKAKGGCPGCGRMVFAVHQVPCPTVADDLY